MKIYIYMIYSRYYNSKIIIYSSSAVTNFIFHINKKLRFPKARSWYLRYCIHSFHNTILWHRHKMNQMPERVSHRDTKLELGMLNMGSLAKGAKLLIHHQRPLKIRKCRVHFMIVINGGYRYLYIHRMYIKHLQ